MLTSKLFDYLSNTVLTQCFCLKTLLSNLWIIVKHCYHGDFWCFSDMTLASTTLSVYSIQYVICWCFTHIHSSSLWRITSQSDFQHKHLVSTVSEIWSYFNAKKTLLKIVNSNFSLKLLIKIYVLRGTSFGELVINLQKTYFNLDCILSEI